MAEYQIVRMEEKKLAGLCARTSNTDPKMGEVIGGLWQKLYQGLFHQLPGKVNDRAIGLYSDYENEAEGLYDITVGCEVEASTELPAGVTVKTIPAGNYAEFVVHGDDVQAVAKMWGEIWQMPLERTFTGDYEEYYESKDPNNREIHLFIAVK